MNFAPHEQRVINEHRELTENLNKLQAFFSLPMFLGLAEAERMRLRAQAMFMEGYQAILRERIDAFMRAHAEADGPSVVAG